jgi:hypothetical protein
MKHTQNHLLPKLNLMRAIPFVLLCFVFSNIQSQEVVLVSGGNAVGSGGTSSYSVGQTIQTTINGSNGSVIQGIQFYIESETLTIIDLATNLEINTYPNPTSSILNLRIDGLNDYKLSYKLFNLIGVIVSQGHITNNNKTINLENLPSATYMLQVENKSKALKTFKIIKN